ncbi:MAG: hypothetical protein GY716_17460 [bacterium]|nr:hypothetical protein [bacterium]
MSRFAPGILLVVLLIAGPLEAQVVINEVMYNSPGTPDVEFVELYNAGGAAVDLTGWYLLDDDDGHDRCPLAGTLDPGGYLVVAGRLDLFGASYPGVTNLNVDEFGSATPGVGFGLGNTADDVRLFDAADALRSGLSYTDDAPWPSEADGDGPSLELTHPALDPQSATNWAAGVGGGTPGEENSTFVSNPAPQILGVGRNIQLPRSFHNVTVTADVVDDESGPQVELWVDDGTGYSASTMFDDGLNGDAAPGDGRYGATIGTQPPGTIVRYYVSATDTLPQTVTDPSAAPQQHYAYTVNHELPALRISELLASNQDGLTDGAGETEDWVEIHNRGVDAVDLDGLFLTEDLDETQRWALPAVVLQPAERVIVFCDDEVAEGPFHASFRLSRGGGEIGLFESIVHGNVPIHRYTFGVQSPDVSFGFLPDHAARPDYIATPTPLAENTGLAFSDIVVNEVSAADGADWIELYNRGDNTLDIGGWHLSDDYLLPTKYTFPLLTLLESGDHLALDSAVLGFNLAADGSDVVQLSSANGDVGRDYLDYGAQAGGMSYGRLPDGAPEWHHFDSPSPGTANACNPAVPLLSPVQDFRFDGAGVALWDPLPGAAFYDLVRGEIEALRGSAGDFTSGVTWCDENNLADVQAWIPEQPSPGTAQFYLVRGNDDACGFGTYDSAAASQQGFRDAEIAAAAASCP